MLLLYDKGEEDAEALTAHVHKGVRKTAEINVPDPHHRNNADVIQSVPLLLCEKKGGVKTFGGVVHERHQQSKECTAQLHHVAALVEKVRHGQHRKVTKHRRDKENERTFTLPHCEGNSEADSNVDILVKICF